MKAVAEFARRVFIVSVVAGGLLIGFPAVPLAQPESRIQGRVSDVCGAVLPGVTITVNGESHRVAVHSDSQGRFDVQGLPPGMYTVSASLTGFTTINRPGLELVPGETLRLDFVMEVGVLTEHIIVIASPREAYRGAGAVVQLRVVESLDASFVGGRPTVEHRVAIMNVIKPYKAKQRPDLHTPPPTDRIAAGANFSVLQGDSGTVPYGGRVATGRYTPMRVGEEYVVFFQDSCRRLWNIMMRFAVRNGRVYVPKGEPGYSDEWDKYDGIRVGSFITALRKLENDE